MRCPICNREATWEGNAYRPFCSERCQLLDLGNWLAERYRISTPREAGDREERAPKVESDADGNRD